MYIITCVSSIYIYLYIQTYIGEEAALEQRQAQWHTEVRHLAGVLLCVAVCCSVLQRVAVCCSVLQHGTQKLGTSQVCCSELQCVAAWHTEV